MKTDIQAPEDQAPDPSDVDLVNRAREGDYSSYEELIRRYQRRVYALFYNMTSHKEGAEDLVQEVFVKAYRSLDGFKRDASFSPWIYRIAVHRRPHSLRKL